MKNQKRTGKFYRRNESEVMRSLGLEPTKNSGSGWVEKEDGQSESVICQLKSTDAKSMRLKLDDWQTLEYNASVSHKLPLFAVQFLQTGDVFLMVRPGDFKAVSQALDGEAVNISGLLETGSEIGLEQPETKEKEKPVTVKSSKRARERFSREWESQFEKKARKAK